MRILSRHHDYYDWVAGHGVNPAITYARTPRSVLIDNTTSVLPWPMRLSGVHSPLEGGRLVRWEVVIGIFPRLYHRWMTLLHRDNRCRVRFFDDRTSVFDYMESLGLDRPRRYAYYYTQRPEHSAALDRDLSPDQWRLVGAPIFTIAPIGWINNRPDFSGVWLDDLRHWYTTDPILQALRFTDVPATDVFQRIQSFLRLDPPPPAEFDDAQKLSAHGFDGRSFRHRKKGKR